jgi:transcriptional regulator with XRE-family HTH domain
VPAKSPTVRRRRLAMELRRLREAAGLTIEGAAERLDFSSAKLSRIETIHVTATPADVRHMVELYGADEHLRDSLIQIAREARQKGWWQANYADLPGTDLVGLETEAATLRIYSGLVVPALLQIAEYTRAILRAVRFDLNPQSEEIERRVEFRMARQAILFQDSPPATWVVLDEAALRRPVGGSTAMHRQLQHLSELPETRNVTLQVLPYGAGEHAGMSGAFTIIGFPEQADPDVVFIENTMSDLYLEDPRAISQYTLMFDHMRAAALSPSDSAAFLDEMASEL